MRRLFRSGEVGTGGPQRGRPQPSSQPAQADGQEPGTLSLSVPLVRARVQPEGLPGPQECDFIAIDFETANETRASACAVGVALVADGTVIAQGSTLIDPLTYFNPYNTMIHGIDEATVRGWPTFADLWPELTALLDGHLVVAHNASFDASVLRNTAARCEVRGGPSLDLACTYRLAKRVLPGYASYSLGYLAPAFGINFVHHEAGEDARACAALAEVIIRQVGCSTLSEAAAITGYELGHLDSDSYVGFRYLRKGPQKRPQKGRGSFQANPDADPSHALYGKSICFTGALASMLRHEAAELLVQAGGSFRNNVSKSLDYLVIGDADFVRFADGWTTSKLARATKLVAEGAAIEIVPERAFLELLFDEGANGG